MKAYVVDRYKQPLRLADLPEPTVGDHDVLIAIAGAGVNVLDEKVRAGQFKLVLSYKTPFALGHDLAGVVAQTGPKVTRFTIGDEVFGRPRDGRIGTFAQRLAVHEDDVSLKPSTVSMAVAASVPLVALTAWQALVEVAHVGPGQKVLIHGGSGGVGTYAVQLAKHLGATVATTTGTSNLDWVRDLGADTVIDYKTQQFDDLLSNFDVVLDSQGGDTLTRSLGVLKPGGIAISIAGPPDPEFARRQGLALPLRLAITAMSWKTRHAARSRNVRYAFLFMRPSGEQLAKLAALVETGALRPIIDHAYPFSQAPAALAHVAGGRSKGKVVISSTEASP